VSECAKGNSTTHTLREPQGWVGRVDDGDDDDDDGEGGLVTVVS